MAYLTFLWIDGVRGASQDTHHLGDIDVLSYSFGEVGAIQASAASGGGHLQSKASSHDFTFWKKIDGASAQLWNAWHTGHRFPTMILSLEKDVGGRSSGELLRYVMRDVVIMDLRPGGLSRTGGDDSPTEEIGVSFASIDTRYKKD